MEKYGLSLNLEKELHFISVYQINNMKKNLNCIMLIDDDADDNFFHEREIKKYSPDIIVIIKNKGLDALEFLKSNKDKETHPDLIFLDINMPGMNGWEFLQEYDSLDKELQSMAVVIMLTTSQNPDDVAKAKKWNCVCEYINKPLTRELMNEISNEYFQNTNNNKKKRWGVINK